MNGLMEWLRRLFGWGNAPAQEHVVVIDPGHGGKFSGATVPHPDSAGEEVEEKDVTLAIGLALRAELQARGYRVTMTRDSDTNFASEQAADLRQRAEIANLSGAEAFVSIHCNAAENAEASGVECYHYPGSSQGAALASAVHAALRRQFPGRNDRGIKAKDFAVLRLTTMPACLIETEFMTHQAALRFLLDPHNQTLIARAIAAGLEDYFAG